MVTYQYKFDSQLNVSFLLKETETPASEKSKGDRSENEQPAGGVSGKSMNIICYVYLRQLYFQNRLRQ